jgi:2-polyprenyl-3-methyl-5-hydroxy-6-metoxy-1,4-benzoquinol methylase
MRCAACGFLYPLHTLTPDGIERYYREVFASPWHRAGQRLNSFVNAAAIARLLDPRRLSSFLDVGTGYGFLLHRLERLYSLRGVGTEPSLQEAAYARDALKADVRPALLRDAGLPKASFDLVACFEVIEHVPDPVAFIAELASYAKPGGAVLINTDNFESRAVRRLGPRFAKWIPHSHISDFAPATLRRAALAVPGLTVERELSYTAWENALRARLAAFKDLTRPPPDAAACFNLQRELGREMNRTYRFWPLRLAVARAWFALTARRDLEGSMMYLLARKA